MEQTNNIVMTDRMAEHRIRAKITDIQWERIIVHMTVEILPREGIDLSEPLDFYAVTVHHRANAKFKVRQLSDTRYVLSLNYTNPGYCKCLPNGKYKLAACQGNDVLCLLEIADELAPLLKDKARIFLHNKKSKGYIIDFSVADRDDALYLDMIAQDMKRCGIPVFNENDHAPVVELHGKEKMKAGVEKKLKSKRHKVIKDIYQKKLNKYRNYSRQTGKKMTLLFMTEQSEVMGSNLTSVMDRIKERGLDKEYNILTSARSMVAIRHYGVKNWIAFVEKLAKADMIFIDDHAPCLDWLTLDPKTTLIQLWHAGAGFKSSGYSRWGHNGCPAPVNCHRQYKYGIAGSRQIAHFFSEVFGINDEQILPTGMPRMDEYLDPKHKEKMIAELYKEFPMCKGKKVILFAPTYRGTNRANAHYPYELIDFDRLYQFCGEEAVVLFKMHPWVPYPVPIREEYKDRFVDVNKYPNINDLFYITDLLITDYSSSIFEFSLMRKPMLFFAFDKVQYSFSRGFHRDYEEAAPGKVCYTFDEVMTALEQKDFEYEKVEEYVRIHFDYTDSHASDRVIDWILLGNVPAEIQAELDAIEEDNARTKALDFSRCIITEEDAAMEAEADDEADEDTDEETENSEEESGGKDNSDSSEEDADEDSSEEA